MFIGVDVSEDRLDVHLLPTGMAAGFTNTPRGIGRLVAWLASQGDGALAVVEATGGLERRLVLALGRAGITVAVVNPRRIRDFARAAGLLAKHALGRPAADPGDRPARCPDAGSVRRADATRAASRADAGG
jgi:transposase